ncbi:hypothetical protein GI374_18320 [Paracoccus sp. S-4012]|uniref:DUF6538 domain-containing protein n=1 Tax=Paracoccus sp. S-4012 TaxID=2665648 RepID=UPI0012AF2A15|nr:DUF6538 domain-containing protein [Paracoccus sp. S-4012]MRX52295.1 hypothetical protein [Paracoccus sp. S-4012]
MKHVQHVRGRWVARMTVPEELRPILNMRELVAPLGTDKRQAQRQALAVLNRFHAILDEAREAYEAGRPTLTSAAKVHYQAELVADDRERLAPGGANDFMKASRPVYANRLRLALSGTAEREELEALVGYAADELTGKGLAPEVPRHVLLRALAEVQLDALARFQERDDGRVKPGEPASPLLTAPEPEPAVMVLAERKGGPTLGDLRLPQGAQRGRAIPRGKDDGRAQERRPHVSGVPWRAAAGEGDHEAARHFLQAGAAGYADPLHPTLSRSDPAAGDQGE